MRIPSQFNDSSLYRPRRGEKNAKKRTSVPGAADSRRRLIRLGVVLLLVIVVMREARRPGLYQTFFDAPEETWVEIEPATTPALALAEQVDASSDAPANRPANRPATRSARVASPPSAAATSLAATWDAAPRWVDAMELPLQRAWIQSLIQLQSVGTQSVGTQSVDDRKPVEWVGLSVEQLDASAEQLMAQSPPGSDAPGSDATVGDSNVEVLAGLQTLRACAASGGCASGSWNQISPWASPLLDALETAAFQRVNDGTFWTSADSDAFYLGLARADQLAADQGVTTGTLPLLQQPEVYRGQTVRLVGRLQLAEKKTAQTNRVAVESYWKLWIIPADGGIRPTILMTRQLPKTIADCLTSDGSWDRASHPANPDGQIAAVGRFIKRLPYRSSIGADLAPVVIGRLVGAKGVATTTDGQAAKNADGGPDADADHVAGITGILFAVLAGIALAGWLMYRSALDAKRTRNLRQQAGDDVKLDLVALTDHDSEKQGPPS
ncbi:hypothetical protein NZK35_18810 [Stieleria sp. ICT_E10.1]|uniref:hypothetical protein n=1 Tax=Stieleria sedimenti TaxID=2976331 RepID=UPI00217F5DF4|nr:hypothetical protein [Stieleria sedimenti]MCS7468709.1 hypothetical protein [Stieleria sedimenti]